MADPQFDIQESSPSVGNQSLLSMAANTASPDNQQWDIQESNGNSSLGNASPITGGIASAGLQGLATSLGTGLQTLGKAVDGTTTQNIGNSINQAAQKYLPYAPSATNDIANNIGRFAPFMALPEFGLQDLTTSLLGKYAASGGISGLLSRALVRGALPAEQGGTFGLTQNPNDPFGGAAVGAVTGLGGAQVLPAAGAIGGGLINKLIPSVAPSLQDSIAGGLQKTEENTPSAAYQNIANNYGALKDKEDAAWANAKNAAANLDAMKQTVPGAPTVNNASYIQTGKDLVAKLQAEGNNQSTLASKNQNAINEVNNLISPPVYDDNGNIKSGHSTNSFADLVTHNQALNNVYRESLNKSGLPADPALLSAVGTMKGALKNTFNENMTLNNNAPEVQNFKNLWDNANSLTQQRNKIYEQTNSPGGGIGNTTFSRMIRAGVQPEDAGNFMNQFVPSKVNKGTGKFNQLSQMLGDVDSSTGSITPNPDLAKQYLTNAHYADAGKTGEFLPGPVLNKYNSLSPVQQNYLHSPEEQQLFTALNNIKNSANKTGVGGKIANALISKVAPFSAVTLGGAHLGHPALGAIGGAISSFAGPAMAEGLAATPAIRDELLARATGQASPMLNKINPYVKAALQKSLSSGLLRGSFIPSVATNVGANQ